MTTTDLDLRNESEMATVPPKVQKRKFRLTASTMAAIIGGSFILILVSDYFLTALLLKAL